MVSSTLQKHYQNHSYDRYYWIQYMVLLFHKGCLYKFDATDRDVEPALAHLYNLTIYWTWINAVLSKIIIILN